MTTPVNFEIAKLLKEKGFDEPCSHAYKEVESPILYIHQDKKYNNSFKKEWQNTVRKNSQMYNATINRYSAPTIAEVVMWIYEKYRIWIEVNNLPNINKFRFISKPIDFKKPKDFSSYGEYFKETKQFFSVKNYDSPTEAYEAAIEYTLKNLIK